ncbi:hypothetical protein CAUPRSCDRAFT_12376 [Caulochytrium protostelioides]|uniref:Uncharacterized protein n=1 Tax=Caulochytrium protostelioides TaxID=1555241 RepID=A0A4P9WUH2_9FUNG|nr:hypothetical protein CAUPRSCDRAFT_12376 [Caulochytrium protostelioides]
MGMGPPGAPFHHCLECDPLVAQHGVQHIAGAAAAVAKAVAALEILEHRRDLGHRRLGDRRINIGAERCNLAPHGRVHVDQERTDDAVEAPLGRLDARDGDHGGQVVGGPDAALGEVRCREGVVEIKEMRELGGFECRVGAPQKPPQLARQRQRHDAVRRKRCAAHPQRNEDGVQPVGRLLLGQERELAERDGRYAVLLVFHEFHQRWDERLLEGGGQEAGRDGAELRGHGAANFLVGVLAELDGFITELLFERRGLEPRTHGTKHRADPDALVYRLRESALGQGLRHDLRLEHVHGNDGQ